MLKAHPSTLKVRSRGHSEQDSSWNDCIAVQVEASIEWKNRTTKLQSSFVRNLFPDIVKTIYPTTNSADKAPESAIVIRGICKLFHLTAWNLVHASATAADCPLASADFAKISTLKLSSRKYRQKENRRKIIQIIQSPILTSSKQWTIDTIRAILTISS